MATGEDLTARLRALEERVDQLEAELRTIREPRRLAPPAPAGRVPSAPGPPPPPPVGPPISTLPPPSTPPPTRPAWTEQITTEVALKWAGLVLVFLAAVFFVSTAISRGWIGPELQLIGAVLLGLSLIGVAARPGIRARRWASSLVAVGVAILLTSAGAASQWLDLGGVGRGMLGAFAAGVAGLVLARWFDSLLVAVTTVVGTVAVPIWLDAPDEYGVVALAAAALAAAVVFHGLAIERSWPELYFISAVLLMLIQLRAAFDQESVAAVQVVMIATALVHWFTPVAFGWRHDAEVEMERFVARLLLVVPSWLWTVSVILHDVASDSTLFLSAAGIGVAAMVSALILRGRIPSWLFATQLLAGSIVISFGLIASIEGSTLLGALAAQALAMLVLSTVLDDTWFRWQSILTATAVLLAAVVLTLEAIEEDAAWGADLVHLGVFAATFGIGWYLREHDVGRVLALLAYAAVLLWVASAFVHVEQGQFVISAIWAAVGLAVVFVALGRRSTGVARVGLATLALVVGKLLTVDLAEIDTFWRAGLFFVIGLGFLWLGYSVPGLMGTSSGEEEP